MRFYGFTAAEIAGDAHPDLDLEDRPQAGMGASPSGKFFRWYVNRAEYGLILRVPGIGVKSARMIVTARRSGRITADVDGTDGGGNEEGALLRDLRRSAGRGMYRRYDAGTGT